MKLEPKEDAMSATFFAHGRGRSVAAASAEDSGRHPLTRAVAALRARVPGLSVANARAALFAAHDGEWHHVGKFARACAYYSVADALDRLAHHDRVPAARAALATALRAGRVCIRASRAATAAWLADPARLRREAERTLRHAARVAGLAPLDRRAHDRSCACAAQVTP